MSSQVIFFVKNKKAQSLLHSPVARNHPSKEIAKFDFQRDHA